MAARGLRACFARSRRGEATTDPAQRRRRACGRRALAAPPRRDDHAPATRRPGLGGRHAEPRVAHQRRQDHARAHAPAARRRRGAGPGPRHRDRRGPRADRHAARGTCSGCGTRRDSATARACCQRLRLSDNPIGWLLTQVWDRFTDRPFYSSQQAIRNVRDESDVMLYLVNAAEAPAAAGYVEAEMQILGWIGKPVVLLLNQMGPPRGRGRRRGGRSGLAPASGALSLGPRRDQPRRLRALLGAGGPAARRGGRRCCRRTKQEAFGRLRDAWRARNLQVFDAAMQALAEQLAAAAVDREPVSPRRRPGPGRPLARVDRARRARGRPGQPSGR